MGLCVRIRGSQSALPADVALRVKALETALVERGYMNPETLAALHGLLHDPGAVGGRTGKTLSASISGSPILNRPETRQRFAAQLPEGFREADETVFREHWQAQAFALAVQLIESGAITWSAWAATLGE